MRTIVLMLCTAGVLACTTSPRPVVVPAAEPLEESRIPAIGISRDGGTLWYARGSERCEIRARSLSEQSERLAFSIDWCPTKIVELDDRSLMITDGVRHGAWKRADGSDFIGGVILAAAGTSNFVVLREGRVIWVRDSQEHDIGAAGSVRAPAIIPGSGDLLAIVRTDGAERIEKRSPEGAVQTFPSFAAIDSFDVAPRGDELVLSAMRDGGFDVAIASPDGKTLNWIPPDREDEVGVTWAPRGNKVSYLIRRSDTTLVRSVHVPTAFQLMFETPHEIVRALAWDPRAERFAMILEGPTQSTHIDSVEYSGANRAPLVRPAETVEREPEQISFGDANAMLLPPRVVRYEEKVPLFVVIADEPLAWSATTRDLHALGGGILRIPSAGWRDGSPLESAIVELPWVDRAAIVVIDIQPAAGALTVVPGSCTLVTTGTNIPGVEVFKEGRLASGARVVKAETWDAAMQYLNKRFRPAR